MKTELQDKTLWYDGSIQVDPSLLEQILLKGIPIQSISVTEMTPDIEKLNATGQYDLRVKTELDPLNYEWVLPEQYKYLDVDSYLLSLGDKLERDGLYEQRQQRLAEEIVLFTSRGLFDLLRVLVYVIDTFKRDNVVWGVGRGSSCSSYILYLMGLHEVDPVKYDISIEDFLGK